MQGYDQKLPAAFCWTRFGTEAGESIGAILERKEQERRANDGTFFWGIGNSVAPGLAALLERYESPEVLFSPIKGRPRPVDSAPATVISWRAGQTLDGKDFDIPATVQVTSGGSRRRLGLGHYALVCSSSRPLAMADLGHLDFLALRNFVSGNPLGASQVTAVVKREKGRPASDMQYAVAFRAALVWPYFVRLTQADPVEDLLTLAS